MAIAGKVAITPKGEWSASVNYTKLDLVTNNGCAYISLKDSFGIEPTNTEYWMLLVEGVSQEIIDNIIDGTTPVGNANQLGGKGASEYLPNSGGVLKKLSDLDGGRLLLEKPTNAKADGNLAVDFYSDANGVPYARIFENGGKYRGVKLDLSKCEQSINGELIHSGNIDEYLKSSSINPNTPITWNQLTPDNFANTDYYSDTFVGGVHTLKLKQSSITWARCQLASGAIAGHKIYVRITADNELCNAIRYSNEEGSTEHRLPEFDGQPRVIITPTYNYLSFQFNNYWANHTQAQLSVNTFDLTLMFGAGNEPTMEEFDEIFPNTHYEYNAGIATTVSEVSLVNVLKDYLPLSGGTVSSAKQAPITVHNSSAQNAFIQYKGTSKVLGNLGFADIDVPAFYSADEESWHKLLHTGNKPTGTYTGNGSATSRTIYIGNKDFVHTVMIRKASSADFAIVTSSGYIAKKGSGATVGSGCCLSSGYISCSTADELFNTSGATYEYYTL